MPAVVVAFCGLVVATDKGTVGGPDAGEWLPEDDEGGCGVSLDDSETTSGSTSASAPLWCWEVKEEGNATRRWRNAVSGRHNACTD